MAGWESLGQLLGGGVDRQAAFMQGQLYSAKTTEAIAKAKMERDKQAAIAELATVAPELLTGPDAPIGKIMAAGMGADYAGATRGRLNTQEYDYRGTLGDALATPQQKANASFAVQGKYEPLTALGAGGFVDIRSPDRGVQTTPLGESLIGENEAQEALYNAKREHPERFRAAGAGSKAPAGYQWEPDGSLSHIPGGPADPAVKAANTTATPPTEGERKGAALATRLENALNNLRSLEETTPGVGRPGWLEKTAGMLGETPANYVRSPDRQQANANQLNALDAALTLSTGAAYTREQLEGMRAAYFPQLGDDDATKAAKERDFAVLVESARQAAGRAAPSIDKSIAAGGPPAAAPPRAPAEITATGPNGQKLVLRDGQWQPLQ